MADPERTIATLCSGGECVGVGARAAGFRHLWGIEHRADVADVAENNGFRSIVANVCDIDPHTLDVPYVLHVSPPCKEASGANGKRIESGEGRAIGDAICRFIEVMLPVVITLENVWYYRTFDSFAHITERLFSLGYIVDWEHLNSADFGVPQTRMRLILRAVRGSLLPILPRPMPWVGWYIAIEDLIPSLPESQFAPWQLARLPDEWKETILMPGYGNTGFDTARSGNGVRRADEPATTVPTLSGGGILPKAFLVDSAGYPQGDERVPICREQEEPANTIVANHGRRPMRAFIVGDRKGQIADANRPAYTVRAGENGGAAPRAFIVDCQGSGDVNNRGITIRQEEEPIYTLTSSQSKRPARALIRGHVVQMTPRCLARFQSIPDEYQLPENKTLACYVIGNAVPPKMYQEIIAQFQTH